MASRCTGRPSSSIRIVITARLVAGLGVLDVHHLAHLDARDPHGLALLHVVGGVEDGARPRSGDRNGRPRREREVGADGDQRRARSARPGTGTSPWPALIASHLRPGLGLAREGLARAAPAAARCRSAPGRPGMCGSVTMSRSGSAKRDRRRDVAALAVLAVGVAAGRRSRRCRAWPCRCAGVAARAGAARCSPRRSPARADAHRARVVRLLAGALDRRPLRVAVRARPGSRARPRKVQK